VLFDLWAKTAEKIVDPEREVWGITKQGFHPHGGRRQASVLESSMPISGFAPVR